MQGLEEALAQGPAPRSPGALAQLAGNRAKEAAEALALLEQGLLAHALLREDA